MADKHTSFGALVQLLRYARGYRTRIVLACVCSALNTLFDVMPEILIGVAIDVVVNREASFLAGFGFDTPRAQILMLGFLTLLIWIGESLFQFLYLILWRNLAQDLQADLRQDAYDQVQRQDMSFFESRSSGELTAILNDDVNQLERFLDGGANDFLQVFIAVLLVSAVFFAVSPTIALLAITPIPVVIWGAFYFMRRASHDYVQANRLAIKVSSAFVPLIRMAILVGFLATFIVGGLMALDGTLNVGAYGMLVFLTQRLLWPLTHLAQTVDLYERAMASTRRILGLIDSTSRVRDTGTQILSQPVAGALTFDEVSFQYDGSDAGIENVSLIVPPGKTLALVGATGSGKSTLIKLLLRFYPVSSGAICIDGKPINTLSLGSLRESIGLVSQDVFLFEGSVRDNIGYGNPQADEAAIVHAAVAAEAMGFVDGLPQGLDTLVGERGIKLSGGQRQRLSLARAILKNPPILILDEATSAVDNETEAAIQRSLAIISHERTVLVVAHRLSTIVAADQIVVLEQGRIVESGTHATLIQLDGYYARQWQVQTGAVQMAAKAGRG